MRVCLPTGLRLLPAMTLGLLLCAGAGPLPEPREMQESTRAQAERLTTQATELSKQDNASTLRQALPLREEALALWIELGDRAQEAATHHAIGHILDTLGEPKKALEAFTRALAIRHELEDARGEAETLTRLGALNRISGDRKGALDAYTRALELWRTTGDVRGESSTLHNLGTLYWTAGDYTRALESYTEARTIRQANGDRRGESETLIGLAITYRMLGDSTSALASYQTAIALKREVGDRRGESLALHNVGVLYSTLGDIPRAIEYYTQALAIAREIGDRRHESTALSSLGTSQRLLGEQRKAIAYLEQALPIQETLENPRELASTLSSLGWSHQQLEEYPAALAAYERALSLSRQVTDRRGEAFALIGAGSAYSVMGQADKAAAFLDQARRIQQDIGDVNGEADTLQHMALVALQSGKLDEALERVDESLSIVESVRARVGIPSLRATYSGIRQDQPRLKIEILMQLHARQPAHDYAARAFLASERGRARSLLEIAERASMPVGSSGDVTLVKRQTELRADITRKATARLTAAPSAAPQLDRELQTLIREYEIVQGRIREADPAYTSLATPLERVADIQSLLDQETALVEYSLGKERSFAWVITRDGFQSVVLADGDTIDRAARQFFELVSAPPRRAVRVQRREAAAALSRLVIEPIRPALTRQRLLIVSDGALHYVPFAALAEPGRLDATGEPAVLVKAHELVHLPSAAVLAVLRARPAGQRQTTRTLAVFADPVHGRDDPRLVTAARGAPGTSSASARGGESLPANDAILKAMTDTGLPRLERLAASGREADGILALVPPESALRAVGFDAERSRVLSPDLASYSVVHFATHGLLNSRRPELSGIVLSLVDRGGKPQDGFVPLTDIFSLRLNAELVVLSACRTALGQDVKGEGLIGVTRGFMYAGVPRVVASLWDVDDVSTVELMTRFYRDIFKQKRSPSVALRAAQLAMMTQPRWSDPYYWATFTLQGDWRGF